MAVTESELLQAIRDYSEKTGLARERAAETIVGFSQPTVNYYTTLMARRLALKGFSIEEAQNMLHFKILEVCHKFDGTKASFRTWISVISYRFISSLPNERSKEFSNTTDEVLERVHSDENISDKVHDKLVQESNLDQLHLIDLTTEERECVRRAILGQSPKHTARELEVPPSLVHRSLFRARVKIRKAVADGVVEFIC